MVYATIPAADPGVGMGRPIPPPLPPPPSGLSKHKTQKFAVHLVHKALKSVQLPRGNASNTRLIPKGRCSEKQPYGELPK